MTPETTRSRSHSWVRTIFSKKRVAKAVLRPRARVRLEELESRLTPANYSWTGNAGTLNWGDPNNWSGSVVPGSADDVTISKAGVSTITIGAGNFAVRSLNDTTAGLSIGSGASLSLAAIAATSAFGQNVTIQSGGMLAIGAGAGVLIQPGRDADRQRHSRPPSPAARLGEHGQQLPARRSRSSSPAAACSAAQARPSLAAASVQQHHRQRRRPTHRPPTAPSPPRSTEVFLWTMAACWAPPT